MHQKKLRSLIFLLITTASLISLRCAELTRQYTDVTMTIVVRIRNASLQPASVFFVESSDAFDRIVPSIKYLAYSSDTVTLLAGEEYVDSVTYSRSYEEEKEIALDSFCSCGDVSLRTSIGFQSDSGLLFKPIVFECNRCSITERENDNGMATLVYLSDFQEISYP